MDYFTSEKTLYCILLFKVVDAFCTEINHFCYFFHSSGKANRSGFNVLCGASAYNTFKLYLYVHVIAYVSIIKLDLLALPTLVD